MFIKMLSGFQASQWCILKCSGEEQQHACATVRSK